MSTIQNGISGLGRRRFLRQVGATGVALGVGQWLASCGGSPKTAEPGSTELRSFYLDLSNADQSHNYVLVAGNQHHAISALNSDQINLARTLAPELQLAENGRITHLVTAPLPADRLQMLHVRGISNDPASVQGAWTMHTMFYHVPSNTTAAVAQALAACGRAANSPQFSGVRKTLENVALAALGVGSAEAAAPNYCTGVTYDKYKDYFDHAVALISHHPEVGSFDAATLAYVQQSIICGNASVLSLAQSIYRQGPSTDKGYDKPLGADGKPAPDSKWVGGWAQIIPIIDPITKLPRKDAKGHFLQFTQYSPTTLRLTGAAIAAILPLIKNDPILRGEVTGFDTKVRNSQLKGKLSVVRKSPHDTTHPSSNSAKPSALSSALSALLPNRKLSAATPSTTFTARDISSGAGFRIYDVKSNGNRVIEFKVNNWYLRYLVLTVRFFDGSGNKLKNNIWEAATDYQSQKTAIDAALAATVNKDDFNALLSEPFDAHLGLVQQELVLLGIPIQQDTQSFSFTMPPEAASCQIVASGMGQANSNDFPFLSTLPGFMTVLMDIMIPGVFLARAATQQYATFTERVSVARNIVNATLFQLANFSVTLGVDIRNQIKYGNQAVYLNLAPPLTQLLFNGSMYALMGLVQENLAEGEAEGALEDCIPFGIGLLLQAVSALGTVAAITETCAESANSPAHYVTEVTATHNLVVTINPDPLDASGFPATAATYRVYAYCDGGSVHKSVDISMPGTTQSGPLVYQFSGLPSGGKVKVTVTFLTASGWIVGAGEVSGIDNTQDAASVTITEMLVPLTSSTRYSHKQKISLNAAGERVWQVGTVAPLVSTNCVNISGNLCQLVGITLSEPFAAIGYSWQSNSAGVTDFANGASGNLYQFANISFTEKPQSGYKSPGNGFSTPARVAYDLKSASSYSFYIDSSRGANIVRRITMSAKKSPPEMDLPGSNLAVGRFNHASDAFLIHPSGRLISINTALHKFEVLKPASTPVPDSAAPLANSFAGPGSLDGLLLGPVCMAVSSTGAILVLEQQNNRIQAFDTGANPTLFFDGKTSFIPLRPNSAGATFMDMAVESTGYIYVLSAREAVYTLDIYKPSGEWLSATNGVNAGKLTVDLFRNLYTLNFETLKPIGDITEPSISQWIPSTPAGS